MAEDNATPHPLIVEESAVREAVGWAKAAVAADRNLDYTTATQSYSKAASLLHTLNSADAVRLASQYDARANALEAVRGDESARRPSRTLQKSPLETSRKKAPATPRRAIRQRHLSLSKLPFRDMKVQLGSTGPCEPPPADRSRRTFWKLRLLRRTVLEGSFLTPQLYVPKEIWEQHGARIYALAKKEAALHEIADHCGRLPEVFQKYSNDARRFFSALKRLITRLEQTQNSLSPHLSFVPEVSDGAPAKKISLASSGQIGFGQLWKDVRTLGQMAFEGAKKGATSAIVKIGNIGSGRLSGAELTQYARLLVRACDASIFVEELMQHFATVAGASPNVRRLAKVNLERLSSLLHTLVVELMLHDLRELLERYVRKSRKSYSRPDSVLQGDDPYVSDGE